MWFHKSPDPFRQFLRSLLQKAVRRGQAQLVREVYDHLLETGQKAWLRQRAYVIGFEECWPVFSVLPANPDPLDILVTVTRSVKRKEAPCLGSLALALSEGDRSVLNGSPEDRHIRVVAAAIARPDDFWAWADRECREPRQKAMLEACERGYRRGGFPWDKPMMLASAYLSAIHELPTVAVPKNPPVPCPYWVSLDKHTEAGKNALRKVSAELGIPCTRLAMVGFYLESMIQNETAPSEWYKRELRWRMETFKINAAQGKVEWGRAKPLLMELLEPAARHLLNDFGLTWENARSL